MMNGSRGIIVSIVMAMMCMLVSLSAQSEETIWLRGTFQEVDSASPVIATVTAPVDLVGAIVAATPKQFLEDAQEEGFDVNAIYQAVEAMPVNESFKIHNDEFHLDIEKYSMTPEETKLPTFLVIKTPEMNVPVPLATTGIAVSLLQFTLKELKGLDDELAAMLVKLKTTPPGLILKSEDKLMDSWLEIRLQ